MKEEFGFRDLLAIPFWAVAQWLDYLAVSIGGKWTARLYTDNKPNLNK